MSVLLLRIAGPLQSWGDSSRFNYRATASAPTKSGILGLIAAAEGRRRTDPVEDLVKLRFGVRIDQPGSVLQDFQTTHDRSGNSKPLSYRSYLTDAIFVAALEGEHSALDQIDHAIQRPKFPLFLGRRSCPPDIPISMGVVDGELASTLESVPWQASEWFRRQRAQAGGYSATILCDSRTPSGTGSRIALRDVPISWDPDHREFGWRNVTESSVLLAEGAIRIDDHNPYELGEES